MVNIYRIDNSINDKIYIGQTKYPIEKRWRKHKSNAKNNICKTYIANAMRKHSIENFRINQICKVSSVEEANEVEQFLIKHFQTNNPKLGYNILEGGRVSHKTFVEIYGEKRAKEIKDKISSTLKSKNTKLSQEHIEIIRNANIGRKRTKESLQKVSTLMRLRGKGAKPILQYNKEGEFIKEWSSGRQAIQFYKNVHISKACNGKLKTAAGFIWKFKNT